MLLLKLNRLVCCCKFKILKAVNLTDKWASQKWKRNSTSKTADNIKYASPITAEEKPDLNWKSKTTMDGRIKLAKKLLKDILDLLNCKQQR